MSNGDTRSESAPASNAVARADDRAKGMASVVERALSVLREHGGRVPAAPAAPAIPTAIPTARASQPWSLDPSALPGIAEIHKQLEQLRNQAQDLVDDLVRILESLGTGVATTAGPLQAPLAIPDLKKGAIPDLAQLQRLAAVAGQATSTRFNLANDLRHPVEVLMKATSLIGPQGFEIPSRYVGFSPNPLLVAAAAAQPVEVTIRVPEQVPPGVYSGLVQGVGLDGASAQLTVDVKPAAEAG